MTAARDVLAHFRTEEQRVRNASDALTSRLPPSRLVVGDAIATALFSRHHAEGQVPLPPRCITISQPAI